MEKNTSKNRSGNRIQCDIRGAIMKMFSRFIFMAIHCIGLLILSNSLVYQRNGRDTLKPFSPDVVDLHNNFNHMFCVTETLTSTAIYYLLVGVFPPNQHLYIYYFLWYLWFLLVWLYLTVQSYFEPIILMLLNLNRVRFYKRVIQ